MVCDKISYHTKQEAQIVIDGSRKDNRTAQRRRRKLQYSYKCTKCGKWHITSQKPSRKRNAFDFKPKAINIESKKDRSKKQKNEVLHITNYAPIKKTTGTNQNKPSST
jgi:hypothetical protein